MVKFKHSSVLSNPLLMCMVGPSGCGKTHLLFEMLTTPGFLDFENLFIYTTTPNQSYYTFLKGLEFMDKQNLQNIHLIYENDEEVQEISVEQLLNHVKDTGESKETGIKVTITSNSDVLNVDKIDSNKRNLIIFDDCVTQTKQHVQQDFFTKGRHYNCHCIYLSQSFYDMDKLVRLNSNCFVFFRLNQRNLTQIMQSVDYGMDPKDFRNLCKQHWYSKPYNYVFVNTLQLYDKMVKTNLFT